MNMQGKTYDTILSDQLQRVDVSIDKREGSLIDEALRPASYWIERLYIELAQMFNSAFIGTATGSDLDNLVELRAIYRMAPTAAQMNLQTDVAVPIGFRCQTMGDDRVVFATTNASTQVGDSLWNTTVQAQTLGSVGNIYTGPALAIDNVSNLTLVNLSELLIPGEDQETDDALRQRYLDSFTSIGFGGNIADYRQYVLEQDGVGGVQVWPLANGNGTVGLSIIGSDFNVASSTLITTIQNLVMPPTAPDNSPIANGLGMAPIGANVTVTTPTATNVDFVVNVLLGSGVVQSTTETLIQNAINNLMLNLRQEWGKSIQGNVVAYPLTLFYSQVMVAIASVEGVSNVDSLTLNGNNSNIVFTQTATEQQLPFTGNITVNFD